jgi:mRNA interferase RelE/StbE
MASYKIEWKNSARKELKNLDKAIIPRILNEVEQLIENPYPAQSRKLQGAEHLRRIRVGDYRVIYSTDSTILVIEIIRVGHGKNIYQRIC